MNPIRMLLLDDQSFEWDCRPCSVIMTASRGCSLLLVVKLSSLPPEAGSPPAVTAPSVRPQERITAMLRNHLRTRGAIVWIGGGRMRLGPRSARSKPEQTSFQTPLDMGSDSIDTRRIKWACHRHAASFATQEPPRLGVQNRTISNSRSAGERTVFCPTDSVRHCLCCIMIV